MLNCGIYEIVCCKNNKRYVGSSKSLTDRLYKHKYMLLNNSHHSKKLQAAWNKHGELNFKFNVMLYCSIENLQMYEQTFIDFNECYTKGYNSAPNAGGQRNFKHSDETKRLLSEIGKGRPHSEKHKQALAVALQGNINSKGNKLSKEFGENVSKRNVGNTYSLGKKRSVDFSEKLSARNFGNTYGCSNKGKPKSEQHRLNLSVAQNKRYARERALRESVSE
jgi:group I intron endonuclease